MSFSRQLPLASDRDRIAAARYAAEKLAHHMSVIAKRKRLLWVSYYSSDGAVVSRRLLPEAKAGVLSVVGEWASGSYRGRLRAG